MILSLIISVILNIVLMFKIRMDRDWNDYSVKMWTKFEDKYYSKCRIIYDILKKSINMNQRHFLDKIESIAGVELSQRQKLDIITALAELEFESPHAKTILTLKKHDENTPDTIEFMKYVRLKHKSLKETRFPDLTEDQVIEAVENVLNGCVHDVIEIEVSNDIITK